MTKRYCYHSDESFYDREFRAYRLARITEGEDGYIVDGWHVKLSTAQAVAAQKNRDLLLTDDDVMRIRISSMTSRTREEVDEILDA